VRIISVPQARPYSPAAGYCSGAEAEGTNLCVPEASQGWRERLCPQTRQHDKFWEGVVVMEKVAEAGGIQGTLLMRGMGKCC